MPNKKNKKAKSVGKPIKASKPVANHAVNHSGHESNASETKSTQSNVRESAVDKSVAQEAVAIGPLTGKVKPLFDRVVIKEDTESTNEKKTSSGIIIPITVNDDKGGKRGLVMAVGPGRIEDGKLIASVVKAGDKVIFQWGDKVRIGEDDYYIVRESEILAIIK